jgi:hypothetical protein
MGPWLRTGRCGWTWPRVGKTVGTAGVGAAVAAVAAAHRLAAAAAEAVVMRSGETRGVMMIVAADITTTEVS